MDEDSPYSFFKMAVALIGALFVFGMGVLLYFIQTGSPVWAAFWWVFVFAVVCGGAAVTYESLYAAHYGVRVHLQDAISSVFLGVLLAGAIAAVVAAATWMLS